MKKDYSHFPGLEGIYLEDSFVIGISENSGGLAFEMEFAILENHLLFSTPKDGEFHCFAKGTLTFVAVQEIIWKKRSFQTFMDADQDIDFGNIDAFFEQDGKYYLEGDWGQLELIADAPIVKFA